MDQAINIQEKTIIAHAIREGAQRDNPHATTMASKLKISP